MSVAMKASKDYKIQFVGLKEGEHRFTYLINGLQPFADPTILTREPDGFGGENSIFYTKNKT